MAGARRGAGEDAGRAESARLLLGHGANANASFTTEAWPDAAQNRHDGALLCFHRFGFDLEAKGESGERPLHWAAWYGRGAAVRAPIACGVQLGACDAQFCAPPIGWCAHGSENCCDPRGDHPALAEALIAAGAPVPRGTQGNQPKKSS